MFRIQNKQAFTLLEMLIVLTIFSSLALFTLPFVASIKEQVQADLVVAQIKDCISLTRQYAQISGRDAQVVIDWSTYTVSTNVPRAPIIKLPTNLSGNSVLYYFSGQSGHLRQYQIAVIQHEKFYYSIRMQFGKGVFWVEKNSK